MLKSVIYHTVAAGIAAATFLTACTPRGNEVNKSLVQISDTFQKPIDLAVLDFDQDPQTLFKDYRNLRFDNGVLGLKGGAYYLESISGFRYGSCQFQEHSPEEALGEADIIFTTTPDETRLRLISLGMGNIPDTEKLIAYLDAAIGPARKVPLVKTENQEIAFMVWESGDKAIYLESAYLEKYGVRGNSNRLTILRKDDAEAIQRLTHGVSP